MKKILLYFKNIGVALVHIPLAVVGRYKYHEQDSYLKNLAVVVLDLPGNALLGGDPNETISSRSGKAEAHEQSTVPPTWGVGCRLCSFLAVFQQNHCQKAVDRNRGRNAVIPDE